jgi:hypothetical protein
VVFSQTARFSYHYLSHADQIQDLPTLPPFTALARLHHQCVVSCDTCANIDEENAVAYW